MSKNVQKCPRMSDFQECPRMSKNVQFSRMSKNVQFTRMSKNVQKCPIYKNVQFAPLVLRLLKNRYDVWYQNKCTIMSKKAITKMSNLQKCPKSDYKNVYGLTFIY